ncbi:hypothetical protein ACIPCF_08085 [Paracoccus marcusii]|uniref:hypothetical protein n=1 Tax=Paracoccus marcusii TaxID=59779 RepID=UPI0030D9631A
MNDQAIQNARLGGNGAFEATGYRQIGAPASRYPDNHDGSFLKGVASALLLLALAVIVTIAAWKLIDVATGGEDRPEACKAYRSGEVAACIAEMGQ